MKGSRRSWLGAVLLLCACGEKAFDAGGPSSAGAAAAATTFATPAAEASAAATRPLGGSALPLAAGIAWQHASSGADVDAAFAQARREGRPVFVYWGATWCPPCNQLKATLFNRQDFIARSRGFIPVYVDGDSAGAQKLGARFKVSGYPTMVVFNPRGVELTRLPGEVDAARYSSVLTLAMNADRPVAQVLTQALAGGAGAARLSADDWRLLAFYSWETDPQRSMPKGGLPVLLQKLADVCPADYTETAERLRLQAVAAAGATGARLPADSPARAMLLRLLGDETAARAEMDVLVDSAADITRALSAAGTPERRQLAAAFDAALKRMETDALLSRADRLGALAARVDLARIDAPKPDGSGSNRGGQAEAARQAAAGAAAAWRLPDGLLADVRETAARADREISDGYERQAVITAAADMLAQAGLGAESDALLKANLGKSHSPYYLMSELAGNARKRGDRVEALHWYRSAFTASEGPATRLQWGASYLKALVELAPEDEPAIESLAAQIFSEAAALPDAFDGRSGRSLHRVGKSLQAWSHDGNAGRDAAIHRLQARLDGVCSKLPSADSGRADCRTLLKSSGDKTSSV